MSEKKDLTVMAKLLKARDFISKTTVKKEGKNKFSNYDYFTPSQITSLVTRASVKNGILPVFNIENNEGDFLGVLTIYDVDSDGKVVFSIPTATPDIKATNVTQKLGGMVTYTQRYLEMIAFGITDNNLDLDSQDNRGAKEEPKKPAKPAKPSEPKNPEQKKLVKLDDSQLKSICTALEGGNAKYTKEKIIESYDLTKEQIETINKVEVKPENAEKK